MGCCLSKFQRPNEASPTKRMSSTLNRMSKIFRRSKAIRKERSSSTHEQITLPKGNTSRVIFRAKDNNKREKLPQSTNSSGNFHFKANQQMHHAHSRINSLAARDQTSHAYGATRHPLPYLVPCSGNVVDPQSYPKSTPDSVLNVIEHFRQKIEKFAAMDDDPLDSYYQQDSGYEDSVYSAESSCLSQAYTCHGEVSTCSKEDESTSMYEDEEDQQELPSKDSFAKNTTLNDLPLHLKVSMEFPRFPQNNGPDYAKSSLFDDGDLTPVDVGPLDPNPTVKIPMVVNGQIFPLEVERNSELAVAYHLIEYYADKKAHIAKRICTIRARLGAKFLFPVFVHGNVVNIPLSRKDDNSAIYSPREETNAARVAVFRSSRGLMKPHQPNECRPRLTVCIVHDRPIDTAKFTLFILEGSPSIDDQITLPKENTSRPNSLAARDQTSHAYGAKRHPLPYLVPCSGNVVDPQSYPKSTPDSVLNVIEHFRQKIEKFAAMDDDPLDSYYQQDSGYEDSVYSPESSCLAQDDTCHGEVSTCSEEDESTSMYEDEEDPQELPSKDSYAKNTTLNDLPLHLKVSMEFPRFPQNNGPEYAKSSLFDDGVLTPVDVGPLDPNPTVKIPMVVNGQIFPLEVERNSELAVAYHLIEYYADKKAHIAKRICTIRARLGAKFLFPVFVHGNVVNIPLSEKDDNENIVLERKHFKEASLVLRLHILTFISLFMTSIDCYEEPQFHLAVEYQVDCDVTLINANKRSNNQLSIRQFSGYASPTKRMSSTLNRISKIFRRIKAIRKERSPSTHEQITLPKGNTSRVIFRAKDNNKGEKLPQSTNSSGNFHFKANQQMHHAQSRINSLAARDQTSHAYVATRHPLPYLVPCSGTVVDPQSYPKSTPDSVLNVIEHFRQKIEKFAAMDDDPLDSYYQQDSGYEDSVYSAESSCLAQGDTCHGEVSTCSKEDESTSMYEDEEDQQELPSKDSYATNTLNDLPLHLKVSMEFPRFPQNNGPDYAKSSLFDDGDLTPVDVGPLDPNPTVKIPMVVNGQIFPLEVERNSELAVAYHLIEYYADKKAHIAKRICTIRARLGAKFLFPVFVHGNVVNIPLNEKDDNENKVLDRKHFKQASLVLRLYIQTTILLFMTSINCYEEPQFHLAVEYQVDCDVTLINAYKRSNKQLSIRQFSGYASPTKRVSSTLNRISKIFRRSKGIQKEGSPSIDEQIALPKENTSRVIFRAKDNNKGEKLPESTNSSGNFHFKANQQMHHAHSRINSLAARDQTSHAYGAKSYPLPYLVPCSDNVVDPQSYPKSTPDSVLNVIEHFRQKIEKFAAMDDDPLDSYYQQDSGYEDSVYSAESSCLAQDDTCHGEVSTCSEEDESTSMYEDEEDQQELPSKDSYAKNTALNDLPLHLKVSMEFPRFPQNNGPDYAKSSLFDGGDLTPVDVGGNVVDPQSYPKSTPDSVLNVIEHFRQKIEKFAAMDDDPLDSYHQQDSGHEDSVYSAESSCLAQDDTCHGEVSTCSEEDESTSMYEDEEDQQELPSKDSYAKNTTLNDLPLHLKVSMEFPRFPQNNGPDYAKSSLFDDGDLTPVDVGPLDPNPTVKIPMVVKGQIFPLEVERNSELAVAYHLIEYYADKKAHIAKRICTIRARLGAKFLFPVFVHGNVVNIPLSEKDDNVRAYREISAFKCFKTA
eukprot:gene3202-1517_t